MHHRLRRHLRDGLDKLRRVGMHQRTAAVGLCASWSVQPLDSPMHFLVQDCWHHCVQVVRSSSEMVWFLVRDCCHPCLWEARSPSSAVCMLCTWSSFQTTRPMTMWNRLGFLRAPLQFRDRRQAHSTSEHCDLAGEQAHLGHLRTTLWTSLEMSHVCSQQSNGWSHLRD